jgi:hypothetical protein
VDCNSSFTFNFSSFREQINVSLAFFHKDIQVFLISEYKQITILASKKTKKKLCFWGYFGIFTLVFCVIKRTLRGILVFSCCILYF